MNYQVYRQVVQGKGQIVIKIPIDEICDKYDVSIKSVNDFQNTIKKIIDTISEDDWLHLFEHGIINKYGYAITYEFSYNLGKTANRFMYVLKRPNKTIALKPYEHMLFEFGDALVAEIFGDDYELDKISILMSIIKARMQVKHIDYTAKLSDDETDFAIIFTFKHIATVSGWDFSQHIVRAAAIAKQRVGEDANPATYLSIVREELRKNVNFEIDIDMCTRKDIHFGIDEMMIFGGNYVHGGAENHMDCQAIRVHYYVTRKGKPALNNRTIVLDNIVWALTRSDRDGDNVSFPQFETEIEYKAYRKTQEGNRRTKAQATRIPGASSQEPSATERRGRKTKVSSQPVEETSSVASSSRQHREARQAVSSQQERQEVLEEPRKSATDNTPVSTKESLVTAKRRGRPPKVPSEHQSIQQEAPEPHSVSPPQTPKRRGRPPKVPQVEVQEPKSRGRPPKVSSVAQTDSQHTTNSTGRPVGRPRKVKNRIYIDETDRPRLGRPPSAK